MAHDICMTTETRRVHHAVLDILIDTAEDGETILDDLGFDRALDEVMFRLELMAREQGFDYDETTARRIARLALEGKLP